MLSRLGVQQALGQYNDQLGDSLSAGVRNKLVFPDFFTDSINKPLHPHFKGNAANSAGDLYCDFILDLILPMFVVEIDVLNLLKTIKKVVFHIPPMPAFHVESGEQYFSGRFSLGYAREVL